MSEPGGADDREPADAAAGFIEQLAAARNLPRFD